MRTVVSCAALICLFAATDKPPKPLPAVNAKQYVAVPVGAIKIPLRDVQQPDDSTCGPSSLMSICSYYGVGPEDLATFVHHVRTDSTEGTYYGDMVKYAKELGLKVEVKDQMTLAELKAHLDMSRPVICSIQAWADDGKPKDYTTDDNGHYVVAIGYDALGNWYFMDPSANHKGAAANPRYAYLPEGEFLKRWHGDEGMHGKREPHTRMGMVIYREQEPRLRAGMIE